MRQVSRDATAVVLAALVSILTISGAIAGFYGAFISRQAVVETQLAHIQQELAGISATLHDRESTMHDLNQRVVRLEIKLSYLDRRFDDHALPR